MKILSKLSLGAAAAGVIAAPSAATTTTVNFNFANDGSAARDITLGGNATPQYRYQTSYSSKFNSSISSIFNNDAGRFGSLKTVNGPVAFPALGTATESGGLLIRSSSNTNGDRYMPLQFTINGTTTVGNAFFSSDSSLQKIEYAAVGGVPEPAIWAELVAGFALAGAAMRRRRPQTALAA
jgi:hypothetical protein